MLTCYDAAFGRLVDATGVDVVLVGDSVGNVMLGYENTLPVTMEDMLHHVGAVARSVRRALVVADMPFMSYQASTQVALENAARFLRLGAKAVKLEGGAPLVKTVEAMTLAGIPVMGHLGLTPQSLHRLGGYKVQGRGVKAEKELLRAAKDLEAAGAFSIVLELVPRELAAAVTAELSIPVIGIGAGPDCDGQVLVLQDMLGFDDDFRPKFLRRYAALGGVIKDAVNQYVADVRAGKFPTDEHSFHRD
jgi:3-methyl-2-oxobutanoate hydroxymethyltransferase